jgi:hypothetical protein
MPADIIAEGKLSNLQLEAIVYGCQRHMIDLPTSAHIIPSCKEEYPEPFKSEDATKSLNCELQDGDVKPNFVIPKKPTPVRAGFLLGDGAGMGKGRTLAGFVVESIAHGKKKHIWISVSADLYKDAKRDLPDLGLHVYAENNCFNLSQLPYGSLDCSKSEKLSSKTKDAAGKH